MANTKSAAKRARQTERRTLVNRRALTAVKNQLKTARAAFTGDNQDAAKAAAQSFISSLDKAVKTGRVHRNSASRHKSVMAKALAKAAAPKA
ncbi:MAG: ribosomal protein [Chthoniobacteraceae bacterium]|nr:ribosomal protein [Chthoniobacteraceae bacterium]MDB6172346.1 ribosomal protein [Chthoniobacteraceae bacterium]